MKLYAGDTQEIAEETQETGDQETGRRQGTVRNH